MKRERFAHKDEADTSVSVYGRLANNFVQLDGKVRNVNNWYGCFSKCNIDSVFNVSCTKG